MGRSWSYSSKDGAEPVATANGAKPSWLISNVGRGRPFAWAFERLLEGKEQFMRKTPDQILDAIDFRRAESLAQKRKQSKLWRRDVLRHGAPVVFCTLLSAVCILIPLGAGGTFDSWVIP